LARPGGDVAGKRRQAEKVFTSLPGTVQMKYGEWIEPGVGQKTVVELKP
jgi:hypothetical protein